MTLLCMIFMIYHQISLILWGNSFVCMWVLVKLGLMFVRQVLYFSPSPFSFSSSYFSVRVSCAFALASLDCGPSNYVSSVAGMTETCHRAEFSF